MALKQTYVRHAWITGLVTLIGIIAFGFQNCAKTTFTDAAVSEKVAIDGSDSTVEAVDVSDTTSDLPTDTDDPIPDVTEDPVDPPDEICNPLDPDAPCFEAEESVGLVGSLYYLVPAQKELFKDNRLHNAVLKDYRTFGTKVDASIVMTSFDVTARGWESGFRLPDGSQVTNSSGDKLFEWFHLDLSGKINLPKGDYQFGTQSDDGIRITVNGEVIIENDSLHPPRWDCASKIVSFDGETAKDIRVEYFQGPRYQIALQLLVRDAKDQADSCGNTGGFRSIEPEAFSH